MESIFIEEELNAKFEDLGYVSFQLFNQQEIGEIKAFYAAIEKEHRDSNSFFHTTLNTSNESLIRRVNEFLRPYFMKNLAKYLKNFNLTMAGFLAKDSGLNTQVTIHQDWTYVDESKYQAFNLWLSLDDASRKNGCMQFVPYSHRFIDTLRVSPDITGFFDSFRNKLTPYLVDVPTKAGECVAFHQSILHGSRRNMSGEQRIACISCAYPSSAKLLHHFMPDPKDFNNIEQYEINLESLITLKKDKKPSSAKLLGKVSYIQPKVSFSEFKYFMNKQMGPWKRFKNSWVQRYLA